MSFEIADEKPVEGVIGSDPSHFVIYISGPMNMEHWWCGITFDGEFKYGGSYRPDEAARAFWAELEKMAETHGSRMMELARKMESIRKQRLS